MIELKLDAIVFEGEGEEDLDDVFGLSYDTGYIYIVKLKAYSNDFSPSSFKLKAYIFLLQVLSFIAF